MTNKAVLVQIINILASREQVTAKRQILLRYLSSTKKFNHLLATFSIHNQARMDPIPTMTMDSVTAITIME